MKGAALSARGFTLIELLVVLLLLGVIYALAGPMLDLGTSGIDLKVASRQLAAGLRKARSTAISEGHDAALSLHVDARKFSVTGDPKTYSLPAKVDLVLVAADSEQAGTAAGDIRFFPDGSSTGGRITISVGESKQHVDVDWITGRVKVR